MTKILMCCVLVFSASPLFAQQTEPLSGKQILDKMVSVYASCSSYSDKGEAKAVFQNGLVRARPFSTAFIRPSKIRFEFEDSGEDYVVWQDGASVKSWWSVKPQVRLFETLDMALAGAAGVSGGSAIVVPSMLLGDLHDSHRIQNLTKLAIVGEEKIGGRTAYKIEGSDFRDHKMTLWIDKEQFLLLKTFEVRALPDGNAETTLTYKPEINPTIPADKLAFKD
jgi:outer membrane lipoprotein-sorting protein